MVIGIVGAEEIKFSERSKAQAIHWIRQLVQRADKIVSGKSPLGGIDWWAIEMAAAYGKDWEEFPPTVSQWAGGPGEIGFRERNLEIAYASDLVVCIAVAELPPDYRGRRFDACYHCARAGWPADNHVKSGGCWTMHAAIKLGKQGRLLIA